MARTIEAFGEKKSVLAWSKDPRCKVSYTALRRRLDSGEDPEEAIAQEPEPRGGPKQGAGRPSKPVKEKGQRIHMSLDGAACIQLRDLQREDESISLTSKRLLLERLEQLKEESDR